MSRPLIDARHFLQLALLSVDAFSALLSLAGLSSLHESRHGRFLYVSPATKSTLQLSTAG